jgi:hypothetical protein
MDGLYTMYLKNVMFNLTQIENDELCLQSALTVPLRSDRQTARFYKRKSAPVH